MASGGESDNNPREPLLSHPLPSRPWEKVGTNLFQFRGSEFLLCVDYFSKFPEITKLRNTTSGSVIVALKSVFARHGIPDDVISDNGLMEFKYFAESWGFRHTTSSRGHAQSNGQAERTVQTIKKYAEEI